MKIRKTLRSDRNAVAQIYRSAWNGTDGIARRPHEITETYIFTLLNTNEDEIVSLVAENDEGKVIGVVHAIKNGLDAHAHILSDLTIIVDPESQQQGVARQLGLSFLMHVAQHRPGIMRVEMAAPKQMGRIEAFTAAGFQKEGDIPNRYRNVDGSFLDIVLMAWVNPNFDPNFVTESVRKEEISF